MPNSCPVHANSRPFNWQFYADPYATYAGLHKRGGVHRIGLPDGRPAWLVTSYREVKDGLRDQRLARHISHAGADWPNDPFPALLRHDNLITEDPPVHTRLRSFIGAAFSPRRIESIRESIHTIVDQQLDIMARKGDADLVEDFAAPLPISVISEILGIPTESRSDLRRWSDAMYSADQGRMRWGYGSMLSFLAGLAAAKRQAPGDDLISDWTSATDRDGSPLSDQELLGMMFFVLFGGYDSTVGVLSTGAMELSERPTLLDRLRRDPALFPHALEELLRWSGSMHTGIRRFATETMTIGGATIEAGETVILGIAAAGRDPERFTDPDVLDFDREDVSHLFFGRGPHACPGSELARMEIRIAFQALFDRFPGLRLRVSRDEIVWRQSFFVRVASSIPVSVQ